jgi:hypothetical protein
MTRKIDKNTALALHFNKRISQRLGIDINRHIKPYLINAIQNNKAFVIERQSLTRAIYNVTIPQEIRDKFNGKNSIIVVYDNKRHKLVTVLDPFYDNKGERI